MADKKISELTEKGTLAGTENVPLEDSGTNKRATVNTILAAVQEYIKDNFQLEGSDTVTNRTPFGFTAKEATTTDSSTLGLLASLDVADGEVLNVFCFYSIRKSDGSDGGGGLIHQIFNRPAGGNVRLTATLPIVLSNAYSDETALGSFNPRPVAAVNTGTQKALIQAQGIASTTLTWVAYTFYFGNNP